MRALLIALVAAGALMAAAIAVAAEPDEATTYGGDGIALTSLGDNYLRTGVAKMSARSDGSFTAERDGELESFLADGAPDPAAPPVPITKGRQLFPAAGGKTLVLAEERELQPKLTRLNPDGSPDTSFGDSGTVDLRYDVAEGVVELGSGKIAVVGTNLVGTKSLDTQVQVTVLNPDGSIDAAGTKERSLPVEREVEVREVVPLAGGGALVVAESFLLELNADGTVDTGFGKQGVVFAGNLASAEILPGGNIEAVGRSDEKGAGPGLAVFRFTATGEPEAGFGTKGVHTVDLGAEAGANTALLSPDGSVVVAGEETRHPCPGKEECVMVPIVAALGATGELEAGFGEGGVLRLNALAGPWEPLDQHGATTLARRPDGSILVAGNAAPEATTAFVAGVTAAGGLIPSFGEGGIVRLRTPAPAGQALAGIAPLPDGGLLAVGTTETNVEESAVLIHYAPDGALDPGFGGGAGYVPIEGAGRGPVGFAVDSEEALTSAGAGVRRRLLMYSTATGQPVSSFGSGGSVALPKELKVRALAFTADGDPLVLAKRFGGQRDEVLRYLPEGRPDKSFGRAGKALLRLPGGDEVDASSLSVARGGKLVVGGRAAGKFAIGRLLANGRPDRRFGKSGWSLAGVGLPAEDATATASGSHVYLAGCGGNEEHNRIGLFRFDRNGHLERGFGHGGRMTASYSRGTAPIAIVPGHHGVLVVTDIGPLPLLNFAPSGRVSREAPGPTTEFVRYVNAATAGDRLFLAWSHPITDPLTETSYIAERPLAP